MPVKRKRLRSNLSGVKLSVIIPVMNERRTLPAVIREVSKLTNPIPEIIVVANGTRDGSDDVAQSMGVRVIRYPEPLGHDVGRSVGAAHATGDVLLFIDGDMRIAYTQLIPFIAAVKAGTDVALNQYSGPVRHKYVHPVVLSKHSLNAVLGRDDLKGSSMTTIPHAISRRALEVIGANTLCLPPKALAIAVHRGLRVSAVHRVNVGAINPRRRRESGCGDPLVSVIVGDHLEAMGWIISQTNERGQYTDLTRKRHVVR